MSLACLASGVTHVGGDMFQGVPEADAIFMKVYFLSIIYRSISCYGALSSQMHCIPDAQLSQISGDVWRCLPNSCRCCLQWILHDWSDEQCIQILKKCFKSLPEKGGKVVLVEMVVPPPDHKDLDELRAAAVNDLLMLAHVSGKERTAAEWEALFAAAGFSSPVTFFPHPGGHFVIQALK